MNACPGLLGILFFVKLLSCNEPELGKQVVDAGTFPLSPGSTWKYAIYDSLKHRADTVVVSIIDSTYLSDGTVTAVWQYAYSHSIDLQYVAQSGDSILVYQSPDIQSLSMILVLPLEVGHQWTSSPPSSMKVTAREEVDVPGGSFARAIRVEQHPFIGNFYGGTTYWFVPDFGLVRMRQAWMDTMADDRVNTVWELLSFERRQE